MNLMPPKLNTPNVPVHRNNPALQIVLLLVILVVFIWLIFVPAFAHLQNNWSIKKKLVDQEKQLTHQYELLKDLGEELTKSAKEAAVLEEILPLDTKISKIYYQTDKLATDAGLSIASINVQKGGIGQSTGTPNGRVIAPVQITINLSGTIDQMIDYMKKLASVNRIYDLENFEVAAQKGSLVSVRMAVVTYYYPLINQANE